MTEPILRVEDLRISYKIDRLWVDAVREFEIEIYPDQIYGIVGESGSGKSTVIKAIIRYLSANGRISGGAISLQGDDLVPKTKRQMRPIWSSDIHMVPQNPFAALNPSIRVGEQIAEVVRIHRPDADRAEVQSQVFQALQAVRLADPEQIIKRYPHELSGGMQQRIVLAMAISTSPQLLLLDEPTTSLDVTTEAVILDLVRDLVHGAGTAAIYVTHNLGVVAQLCERVTVMYAGEIMEDGRVTNLYGRPLHPYTIGLLACVPRFGRTKRDATLRTIPGRPPAITNIPSGCVFADRCPVVLDHCRRVHPPLETTPEGRIVRCHRWQEIASGQLSVEQAYETGLEAVDVLETEALIRVRNLAKHFPVRRSVLDILRGNPATSIKAVDGVNLSIQRGRTLGLVGESGSGKTTLSRLIVGLNDRTAGEVSLMGVELASTARERPREVLRQLQMIFQNPEESLNPYLSIGQSLRRPLIRLAGMKPSEARAEVKRLLQAVNLDDSYARRYPGEISGGEKQRVAIARAFASDPELIVCDEPVSSLDVSVQSAVLNLLARLQEDSDTAYLFISHDLAVVSYLADYIAVMYLGQLFEVGYGHDFAEPPHHPYTEALISAIPIPDPHQKTERIRLSQDMPSSRHLPTGCRFHTRCPRKIGEVCETDVPPWRDDGDGHYIRCHIPLDELTVLQQSVSEPDMDAEERQDRPSFPMVFISLLVFVLTLIPAILLRILWQGKGEKR